MFRRQPGNSVDISSDRQIAEVPFSKFVSSNIHGPLVQKKININHHRDDIDDSNFLDLTERAVAATRMVAARSRFSESGFVKLKSGFVISEDNLMNR